MLFLAKEFTEIDWYPHFKKVKKILRAKRIPFTIKKQPTREGLLHSIWATEENIESVREVIVEHYRDDPWLARQSKIAEEASTKFEENWFYYLLAVIYHYGRWRPLVFWPLLIAIIGVLVAQVFWYV